MSTRLTSGKRLSTVCPALVSVAAQGYNLHM
jgi:hypothetical protein